MLGWLFAVLMVFIVLSFKCLYTVGEDGLVFFRRAGSCEVEILQKPFGSYFKKWRDAAIFIPFSGTIYQKIYLNLADGLLETWILISYKMKPETEAVKAVHLLGSIRADHAEEREFGLHIDPKNVYLLSISQKDVPNRSEELKAQIAQDIWSWLAVCGFDVSGTKINIDFCI